LIEQTDAANQANGPDRQDIAQRSFKELLRWFQIIILQDAVFLREKFPNSSLWNHHIFKLSQFKDFASRLKVEARYGDMPQMVRVNEAIPDVAHILREQHREMQMTSQTQFGALRAESDTQFRVLCAKFDAQFSALCAKMQPLYQLATIVREASGAMAAVQPIQALPPLSSQAFPPPPPQTLPTSSSHVLPTPSVPGNQVPNYRMQAWICTVT